MIRRGSSHSAGIPLTHKIISILLQYPDEPVLAAVHDVDAALPLLGRRRTRALVSGFTQWLRTTPRVDAAQHYVTTFDHTRRRSLYLTYYRHGDTRARGMALLALKHTYRQAGYKPPDAELPDYLPLVLEFAARAPQTGNHILIQCQAGLELLRQGVHEVPSPYAALLDVVCAGLPRLRPRQRDDICRLAIDGPPTEQVGLEPFAPPEFLTGDHR